MKGLLVTSMGAVFCISRRNWRRYCRVVAASEEEYRVDIERYGARQIGVIHANFTDWTRVEFATYGDD